MEILRLLVRVEVAHMPVSSLVARNDIHSVIWDNVAKLLELQSHKVHRLIQY